MPVPVQGVSNGVRGPYDAQVAWNTPSQEKYSKYRSLYHRGQLVKALSDYFCTQQQSIKNPPQNLWRGGLANRLKHPLRGDPYVCTIHMYDYD